VKPKKKERIQTPNTRGDNVDQNKRERERERIQTSNTRMHNVEEEERIKTPKNHGDPENMDQEK